MVWAGDMAGVGLATVAVVATVEDLSYLSHYGCCCRQSELNSISHLLAQMKGKVNSMCINCFVSERFRAAGTVRVGGAAMGTIIGMIGSIGIVSYCGGEREGGKAQADCIK